jgi:hypothetical protein
MNNNNNNNNNNIPSGQPLLCQDGNIYNFGDQYYKYDVMNNLQGKTDYKKYLRIHFCRKDKNNFIKLFFSGINVSNNLEIHPNDSYLLKNLLQDSYSNFLEKFNKHQQNNQNNQINTYFEIGSFEFDTIKSIVLDIYDKIDKNQNHTNNHNKNNNHLISKKRKRNNNNNTQSCSDIENIEELIGYMSGNFNCQKPSKKPKRNNSTQPLDNNNNNKNIIGGSNSRRKKNRKIKSKRKSHTNK